MAKLSITTSNLPGINPKQTELHLLTVTLPRCPSI
uniref:Uncharacterized protein n=1 Tax=Anguilla anguilla TaxID=7936 RepID=A0A0E9SJR8_ANGAN